MNGIAEWKLRLSLRFTHEIVGLRTKSKCAHIRHSRAGGIAKARMPKQTLAAAASGLYGKLQDAVCNPVLNMSIATKEHNGHKTEILVRAINKADSSHFVPFVHFCG